MARMVMGEDSGTRVGRGGGEVTHDSRERIGQEGTECRGRPETDRRGGEPHERSEYDGRAGEREKEDK